MATTGGTVIMNENVVVVVGVPGVNMVGNVIGILYSVGVNEVDLIVVGTVELSGFIALVVLVVVVVMTILVDVDIFVVVIDNNIVLD